MHFINAFHLCIAVIVLLTFNEGFLPFMIFTVIYSAFLSPLARTNCTNVSKTGVFCLLDAMNPKI